MYKGASEYEMWNKLILNHQETHDIGQSEFNINIQFKVENHGQTRYADDIWTDIMLSFCLKNNSYLYRQLRHFDIDDLRILNRIC